MKYVKITAVVRVDVIEKLDLTLQGIGVRGISLTEVKGFGEYTDKYSHDWMIGHYKLEIFTDENSSDAIINVIMEEAHTGMPGDGFISVQEVDQLYKIRTKSAVTD